MDITFKDTPNGEKACSCNNVRLHSFYNPSKEAERFVETAECQFTPSYILVTEPALSYCAPYLNKRFPNAELFCIRFTKAFDECNSKWNRVFYAENEIGSLNLNLSEEIFSSMGEEGISSCLFLSWKASDQAFPETSNFTWDQIKKAVLKSRSVLGTRNYFAKRWTKNALRFSLFAKKTAVLNKGTCDILICASGTSLYSSLDYIKQFRERFFLIAVSSALSPLVHNGITPDLCVSTDGGFYAKRHISYALNNRDIPLALPGEGSSFASILSKATVVPLYYGDGTSEDILRESGFKGMKAVRNGSVSGSALYLALNLTDGNIYYCGLDLAFSKGYVHTQPNELEKTDARFDGRLRTTETRISSAVLNKGAIDIYRSWFSSTDFNGRVFRLSNRYRYEYPLGKIQDIDWDDFEIKTKDFNSRKKPEAVESETRGNGPDKISELKEICRKNSMSREWIHNAVPSEAVVMERSQGTDSYDEAKNIVEEGMKNFLQDITRAIEK